MNHQEAQERGECVCQDVDINSSLSPALEYFKIQFFKPTGQVLGASFYSDWLHFSSLKCLLKKI